VTSELSAGMVGLGWMGGQHLEVLGRLKGIKVTAVCDSDQDRAREVAARLKAESYGSWQDLLERARPDVLWVCTPPGAHREPVVSALKRGVHVYLEKPIARTVEDGAAIVSAAASSSAVCAVGYQWHALDLVERLRAELEGQAVGLMVAVSVGPTQERPWFLQRAQGGGNLLERGSHQVDLVRALAGEVVAVQVAASAVPLARASAPARGDIEDAAGMLLRLRHGGVAVTVVGWLKDGQPGRYSLDVLATDATVRLNLDPDFTLDGVSRGRPVSARAARHPLESSVNRFLEAVRAGDPTRVACPPSDALRTLAVVAACERALASGEQVAVDFPPV
jgi:predicted dehydrogenase